MGSPQLITFLYYNISYYITYEVTTLTVTGTEQRVYGTLQHGKIIFYTSALGSPFVTTMYHDGNEWQLIESHYGYNASIESQNYFTAIQFEVGYVIQTYYKYPIKKYCKSNLTGFMCPSRIPISANYNNTPYQLESMMVYSIGNKSGGEPKYSRVFPSVGQFQYTVKFNQMPPPTPFKNRGTRGQFIDLPPSGNNEYDTIYVYGDDAAYAWYDSKWNILPNYMDSNIDICNDEQIGEFYNSFRINVSAVHWMGFHKNRNITSSYNVSTPQIHYSTGKGTSTYLDLGDIGNPTYPDYFIKVALNY